MFRQLLPTPRKAAMRLLALVLLAAWAAPGLAQVPASQQDERQRLYYSVKPAVVLIWFSAQVEVPVGRQAITLTRSGGGSGWIISPDGYLVTNGHVVELYHDTNEDQLRRRMVYQALEESGFFDQVARRRGAALSEQAKAQLVMEVAPEARLRKNLDVYLQNWRKFPAEVKEYSPPLSDLPGKTTFAWQTQETGKDVAILKIEGRDLPTVRLGDSNSVQIGTEVTAAGYPGVVMGHPYLDPQSALEASFTRGHISSLKRVQQGTEVFQMDAPITWGNSGGPIFNSEGAVIGMATFGSIADMGQMAQAIQGFNFAIPTNTVREFVNSAGVRLPQESLFDRTWKQALDAYYGRQYAEAIAGFDHALRLIPDLPDAVRLRREAIAVVSTAPAQPEPPVVVVEPIEPPVPVQQGMPWWQIALGAALVLGLAGGLVLRQRRRPVTAAPVAAPGQVGAPPEVIRLPRVPGRLVVQDGPERGRQVELSERGVKIGRDPLVCQLVLSDGAVSREHALVMFNGQNSDVIIRNLSGTNPTFVNDRPVAEASLRRGDRIKIGNSIIIYDKEAAESGA